MTAPVLAGLWSTAVLVFGWARRPRPVRCPPPASNRLSGPGGDEHRGGRGWRSLVGALGAMVGILPTLVGRPAARPAGDVARGVAFLAALALAGFAPVLAPVALVALAGLGALRRRTERRRLAAAVEDGLSHATDLLGVAVAAGLTVPLAVEVVGGRVGGPVGGALAEAQRRALLGRSLPEELGALLGRLGTDAARLGTLLASSLRYGSALADPLDRLGSELRSAGLRRAEIAARRLPVKLLFPLVGCLLPAFVLLTVVPVLLTSLRALPFQG